MTERRVNICMVTFNRLAFTRQAMESLSRVRDFPHTLTVVDNHSTDGSAAYLSDLHDRGVIDDLFLLDENLGTARAANIGWLHGPPALYFLKYDNDIVMKKENWLSAMVEVLDRSPRIGVVGYNFEARSYPTEVVEGSEVMVRHKDNIGGACLMVPKRTERLIGYWCQDYGLYSEDDFDYCARVRAAGLLNAYMPDADPGLHLPGGRAARIDPSTLSALDGDEDESYRKWKDEQRRKVAGPDGLARRNAREYFAGNKSLFYQPVIEEKHIAMRRRRP